MDQSEPGDRKKEQPEKEDYWLKTLRFHIEEIKELGIENSQLKQRIRELQEVVKEEHRKSYGVRVKKYLNVILTLVLIGQLMTMIF